MKALSSAGIPWPGNTRDGHHLPQGSRLISVVLPPGTLGSALDAVKHMSNATANHSLLYKAGVYVATLDQASVLQELRGGCSSTQLLEHPLCVVLPACHATWEQATCSHAHLENFCSKAPSLTLSL